MVDPFFSPADLMFVENQRRQKWGDIRKGGFNCNQTGSGNQYDWYHLTGLTKDAVQLDMSFFWAR